MLVVGNLSPQLFTIRTVVTLIFLQPLFPYPQDSLKMSNNLLDFAREFRAHLQKTQQNDAAGQDSGASSACDNTNLRLAYDALNEDKKEQADIWVLQTITSLMPNAVKQSFPDIPPTTCEMGGIDCGSS